MFFLMNQTGKLTQCASVPQNQKFICALGCFDGVHKGHRSLIETVVSCEDGLIPAVWTFSEPLSFPFIETVETRVKLCAALGVRFAFCEEFSQLKKMSPAEFVDRLAGFNIAHIVCGQDFRFGNKREGDINILREECAKRGIALTVKEPVTTEIAGETVQVSSTLIRKLIREGELEKANELLCRPFTLKGVVINGNKIGRTISVPTVNQSLPECRVAPRFGVYDSVFCIDGRKYPAVTNVGTRPTVNKNENNITCETHIIHENLDLYGMVVEVEFHRYNRPEQKFSDLDDLKAQIARDIEHSVEYFSDINK